MRAASFLIIPLYTRTLTVEGYGLLVTLLTTMQFMMIFMNVGAGIALLRFAGQYDQPSSAGKLLGTSCFMNFLGGSVVTVATLLALPLFKPILHTENVMGYMMLTCMASLSNTLCQQAMSLYRARGDAGKFMLVGIGTASVLIITNLIFLYGFHMGVVGALIAIIIAYGFSTMLVIAEVTANTGFGISVEIFVKLFRFGFPLLFAVAGQFIMSNSSMYFLNYYSGLSQVAIFSLGYKIALILDIILILPFHLAFEPFVFTNSQNPSIQRLLSRLFSYLALILVFGSLFIIMISRILIPVMAPPEYAGAYLILLFLLPAVTSKAVSYFGEVMLNLAHKTHITGIIVAFWTLLGLGINYLLVRRYGMPGAVIAANVSSILSAITVLIIGLRIFPVAIQWKRLAVTILLAIGFMIAGYLLSTASIGVFYMATAIVTIMGFGILFISGWFEYGEVMRINMHIRKGLSGFIQNTNRIV